MPSDSLRTCGWKTHSACLARLIPLPLSFEWPTAPSGIHPPAPPVFIKLTNVWGCLCLVSVIGKIALAYLSQMKITWGIKGAFSILLPWFQKQSNGEEWKSNAGKNADGLGNLHGSLGPSLFHCSRGKCTFEKWQIPSHALTHFLQQ